MHIQRSFRSGQGEAASGSGTLYLVATPIGNLEDMTFRAIRTLREVGLIAAEDTRQTRKLLTHYEIQARLVSYHEHNKQASGAELIRLLQEGTDIALVSDAGLPAISDPGSDLVKAASQLHISVVPIPGANAALSALIVSGLPTERFSFHGFPPREKRALENWLGSLSRQEGTLLFYESPHRVAKTLAAMLAVLGDRELALARELTKRYEEIARGKVSECIAWLEEHPPQGEYCLVVKGWDGEQDELAGSGASEGPWWQLLSLGEHVSHYEREHGNRKEAMKQAARDLGIARREVYNQLVKDEEGRQN